MRSRKFSWMYIIFQLIADIGSVYLAYWLAFVLRYEAQIPAYDIPSYWILCPILAGVCILTFLFFKFYSTLWYFAGMDGLIQIVMGPR